MRSYQLSAFSGQPDAPATLGPESGSLKAESFLEGETVVDSEPILSRDEINALLAAVRGPEEPSDRPSIAREPVKSPPLAKDPVEPWDFRRPRTLRRADLRRIQDRHRETADEVARILTEVLKSRTEVRVLPPGEATAAEFLETRSELALIARSGDLFADLSPPIAFALVERLLGAGRISPPPGRPLRPLESDLLAPWVGRLLGALSAAWAPAPEAPICWGLKSLLAGECLPEGPLVAVRLEILSEGILGEMAVAVPVARCDADRGRAPGDSAPALGIDIEAAVRFPFGIIRLRDVERIAPGDLLVWTGAPSPPVIVEVGGIARYAGRPGTLGDRLAVEVLRAAGPEPDPAPVGRRAGGEASPGAPVEVPIELRAVAAARAISLRELSELRPGAVLPFGRSVDAPVEIRLRDRPVARGRAVRIGDQLGVRID